MRLIFYFITALSLCVSFSLAQNKSAIKGKIVDKVTGETLPGATVSIDGTTKAAACDLDGNFSLNDIAPGTYKINVKLISYSPKVISDVVVIENKVSLLNVSLESSSNGLKEVTIEATAKRESQNALLIAQKNAVSVSDGISAEFIKKSPDKNTGEVLKRVSGTSIQDNKFVIVRGLSDRYNFAMINGAPLPSTEPDRRAFSFDMFPSNLIDNITIIKTASPDLPGEFAGGVIQINTRDIPEENFYSFTDGLSNNAIATHQEYYTYKGGKTDYLAMDDGTRALPKDFPTTSAFQKMSKTDKLKYSKLMENDWQTYKESAFPFNRNYQFSMGNTCKIFKNDFGSVFALTYNKNHKINEVQRQDYEGADTTRTFAYNDKQYGTDILGGALWNISYKIGANHKIAFRNLLSLSSEDITTKRTGAWFENQQFVQSSIMQYTSNRITVNQLGGEHLLPKTGIRIKWQGNYSTTKRDVPNLRRTYYSKNFVPNDDADTLFLAYIPGVASPSYGGKFYSTMNEEVMSGSTDASYPFIWFGKKQSIKIGTFQQQKSRDFSARVLGYVVNNFAKFYQNGGQELFKLSEDQIFDTANININGFRIDEITNGSDHYLASSYLNANYLMMSNNIAKKLHIDWGARYEIYNQKLNSKGYSNDTIMIDTTFFDLLPSLNATYAITEKTNLRFAASRTVSRPEFREFAPFSFFDFNLFTAVVGNTKLSRGTINNFDLRFEYYAGRGQLVALSAFYKKFENPIEQVLAFSGVGSRTQTFANVPSAVNYGVEAEFRKNFDFIAELLKWKGLENLSIFSNVAYIVSKVDLSTIVASDTASRPLQGQSPYLINAGLQYSGNKGTNISILFNQIGRRITQVGSLGYKDIYENPRKLVDIQVSQRVLKNVELKAGVSDLLHEDVIFYQDVNNNGKYDDVTDNKMTSIKRGLTISGSLTVRF